MALKISKPKFTAEDLVKLGEEYAEISKQSKVLEARKKELAKLIKEHCETYGTKDDKGSFYFESDTLTMGKVAKKTFKINSDKAIPYLKEHNLEDVIEEVVTHIVSEDLLQKAVQEGRITLEEVESFTDVSTSYSVSVKEKEAMPEVEQSTLKAAKSKK